MLNLKTRIECAWATAINSGRNIKMIHIGDKEKKESDVWITAPLPSDSEDLEAIRNGIYEGIVLKCVDRPTFFRVFYKNGRNDGLKFKNGNNFCIR